MDEESAKLLREWQADGIGHRIIRSHRRPRQPLPHGKIAALAVTTLIALLNALPGEEPEPEVQPPAQKIVAVSVVPTITERDIVRANRNRYRAQEAQVKQQATEQPKPTQRPQWVLPLAKYRLTSCYAYRWGTMHYGIDMAAATGTPIRSVGAGRVVQAGWRYNGYGISVMVDHGNGWKTLYAHASKAYVRIGQWVSAGQTIAAVGSTGYSTGPHLHFAVVRNSFGKWVNPKPWLAERGVRINGC